MLMLILIVLFISFVVRLITAPFRYGYRRRFFEYGNAYNNPYRYGCRRHHRFLGGLLPIVALIAIDRFFGRRF